MEGVQKDGLLQSTVPGSGKMNSWPTEEQLQALGLWRQTDQCLGPVFMPYCSYDLNMLLNFSESSLSFQSGYNSAFLVSRALYVYKVPSTILGTEIHSETQTIITAIV